MKKAILAVNIVLTALLVLFFALSVADTEEGRRRTEMDTSAISRHIEKLSENGPRSLFHPEANEAARDYIISCLEASGLQNADTTEVPAYQVQDYVAHDEEYQNFYLSNVIAHIPANGENPSDEAILFMAHYDSVPMGQGASDDGVSVATMLEAIDYFTERMAEGYTLNNDLVFAFVNGEEFGLYGSEAFMGLAGEAPFAGFENITERIRFGVNLESRGTSGTVIMFETAANNYHTIELFSKLNKSIFSCSIATLVYDMMPNYTDFTSIKDVYQGINMANITGGENYHTQNDSPENVGISYLSQQAEIVYNLIDGMGSFDLDTLYEAEESAIFFTYLNVTTVIYNHAANVALAVISLLLLVLNVVLRAIYRKETHGWAATGKAVGTLVLALVLAAAAAYASYFVFQLIASMFGIIDIHMIGTITYTNIPIVIGVGILTLSMIVFAVSHAVRHWKVEPRDLVRAFAYTHGLIGAVVALALPNAGYLFLFSGIFLLANELAVTLVKQFDFAAFHGELLITALYFPIVVPVIFLATSALGLTMAYVYGLVFALAVFAVGVALTPLMRYFTVASLIRAIRGRTAAVAAAEGGAHLLAVALLIFLVVSLIPANASVNLQGKQNIAKLPYDDALIYAVAEDGTAEYRIYDLNSLRALRDYAPEKLEYVTDHYRADAEAMDTLTVLSSAESGTLTVQKCAEDSLVYLTVRAPEGTAVTLDDGTTTSEHTVGESGELLVTLHSDCAVTSSAAAEVEYLEVVRDYAPLIPAAYTGDTEKLHFNLWLTQSYTL